MHPEEAFENFKVIASRFSSADMGFTESDSRSKIIDEIFKKSLGWFEEDIERETRVSEGFIDYVFKIGKRPVFIVEAKRTGTTFTIPFGQKQNRYKLAGPLLSDRNIKEVLDQAHRYSIECGTTFAVITNGFQFLIFETFRYGGKWKQGTCMVFKSFEDIIDNFTLFWNVLNRDSVANGSLRVLVSAESQPLEFRRPLDSVRSSDEKVGKNFLAGSISPVIQYVFGDLTADDQVELLERCYIQQREMVFTRETIKSHFAQMHGPDQSVDISWFGDENKTTEGFRVSFDKCREFLRKQASGSTIVLLGGVGSGKTTFIHHFFKVEMRDRKDMIWFYIDFGKSNPDVKKIEQMVYESIVRCYEKHYKTSLESFLKAAGIDAVTPDEKSILILFSLLYYKGYSVSIVFDNVDRLTGGDIDYQEYVFQLSQHFTEKLRAIMIITLREETYFRSKKSGILDAYLVPKFHIDSPEFEELLRSRVTYTLDFLKIGEEEVVRRMHGPLPGRDTWRMIGLLFEIVDVSIRKDRRVGKDILRFINDSSGGDMRKALEFFNSYITSRNTDVTEMLKIEKNVLPNSPPHRHYQIPLHHIIKSIMLDDYRYYASSRSHIFNLFFVNAQYTNSHFLHLRLLHYLYRRVNYFVDIELGFVMIDEIVENADKVGINRKAIEDSLVKLSRDGMVVFDNQDKDGYGAARFVKITDTGKYYVESLSSNFAYLDLVFQDTPICDMGTLHKLESKLNIDPGLGKKASMSIRFERTLLFLDYLAKMEDIEFECNPAYTLSDLTKQGFMYKIREECKKEIEEINAEFTEEYL